ncbi:hypothetical protein EWF20_06125 [Sulfolobus sp. S-194]|uniref:hypothetical protein n=1 Tax=Sulfolobus sp. S-194 TaxID=2512240 RepID=UPI001436D8ED|nr:hypothetical protein [Sulfolobus sp. S-194]QIW23775.1 hypothetical protein EWF20_06125 [Sulfolobus sp. S-194]
MLKLDFLNLYMFLSGVSQFQLIQLIIYVGIFYISIYPFLAYFIKKRKKITNEELYTIFLIATYAVYTNININHFYQPLIYGIIILIFIFFVVDGYIFPSFATRKLYRVEEDGFTYYIDDKKYIGNDVVIIYTIKPFVIIADGVSYSKVSELRYKVKSKLILYEKARKYMINILLGYIFGIILYSAFSKLISPSVFYILFMSFFYLFFIVLFIAAIGYYKIKYGGDRESFIESFLSQTIYSSNVNVRSVIYLMPLLLAFSLVTSLPVALIKPSFISFLLFLEKFAVEIILLSIITFLGSIIFTSLGLSNEEFLASFSQYIFFSTIPQLFLFGALAHPSLRILYTIFLVTFTLLAYIAAVLSTNNKKRAAIAWLIIAIMSIFSSIILSLITVFFKM